MKILKNMEKLSLIAIGATTLTLGNVDMVNAQVVQGKISENLNLRMGPSTDESIILTMKKGSLVEVLNYIGDWAYVRYNNKLGYASKIYISETNNIIAGSGGGENSNKSEIMECSVDLLNVRKGPSTSEQVIGKLEKGHKVEVMYHTSKGWSRIKYNLGYGYVSTQYLTNIKSDSEPNKYITMICKADKLNIRKGPSTKEQVIGTLKQGDKIDVIAQLENNWSKVRFNNSNSYVSTLYLSDISNVNSQSRSKIMKCNTTRLNIRSGPSTNDSVIGNLKSGDKVEVIYKVNDEWYKIKYNDGYAYVSSKYLS